MSPSRRTLALAALAGALAVVLAGGAALGPAAVPRVATAGGLAGASFARPPGPEPGSAREPGAAPPVAWRDPNAALAEARRDRKPVLLDVEVTWSSWCTRMMRTTYADPAVREDIARAFVPARLDAEEDARRVTYQGRPLSHRAFADRFRVSTYPTTVFLAPDGTPITRVPGYVTPARFRMLLRFVAEGRYRTTTWEEFAGPPGTADQPDQPDPADSPDGPGPRREDRP